MYKVLCSKTCNLAPPGQDARDTQGLASALGIPSEKAPLILHLFVCQMVTYKPSELVAMEWSRYRRCSSCRPIVMCDADARLPRAKKTVPARSRLPVRDDNVVVNVAETCSAMPQLCRKAWLKSGHPPHRREHGCLGIGRAQEAHTRKQPTTFYEQLRAAVAYKLRSHGQRWGEVYLVVKQRNMQDGTRHPIPIHPLRCLIDLEFGCQHPPSSCHSEM